MWGTVSCSDFKCDFAVKRQYKLLFPSTSGLLDKVLNSSNEPIKNTLARWTGLKVFYFFLQ